MAYGDVPRTEEDLQVFGMQEPTELDIFERNVRAIFEDMTQLLVSKRRSYGPSNLLEDGGYGILIRASDKIGRLRTMYKSGSYANDDGDSMLDAWGDLIGYAVLAILYETEDHFRRTKERVANPPPGESYIKIEKPELPTIRGVTVSDWEPPMRYEHAEADGVNYLIGNPDINQPTEPAIAKVRSVQQAWPSEHNPKAQFKGATIEEMVSWAENTDPNKSFVMYECVKCGQRSFLMENLPYECHPFARKVTVAQKIVLENI